MEDLFSVSCASCGTFISIESVCNCGNVTVNLHLDVDKMLNKLYLAEKDYLAIDIVMFVFFNLYDRFDVMNEILSKTDVTKLADGVLVSFLVQTFKYIKQVPEHINFCDRVADEMRKRGRSEDSISKLVNRYRTTGNYWENMEAYGAPEWLSGPKPKE